MSVSHSSAADNVLRRAKLEPADFRALPGWVDDDHRAAWNTFLLSCRSIIRGKQPLRPGVVPADGLKETCQRALATVINDKNEARLAFESLFKIFRILPRPGKNPYNSGFVTGYYEPVVSGSVSAKPGFTAPLRGKPANLVKLAPHQARGHLEGLTAALRQPDGSLKPVPDRAGISSGALNGLAKPVVWVADPIEAFMIHVQGSARIQLEDGRLLRLTYAGRNGHPYTSIGRKLAEAGHFRPEDIDLITLKEWVRKNGQGQGQAGRKLLEENRSYIFFSIDESLPANAGPTGAAGYPLTAGRSIAIDRSLWAYGLPFWIDAELPAKLPGTSKLSQKLMIAQDTGTAIVGAARADLFVGTGDKAGRLAGRIRHHADMYVLMPRTEGTGAGAAGK